ncbi:PD40 domain-containing protein [Pontibacter sp. SGAir0037]|uniref:PD40 domain-containing protein n=1 Tax=Pontibacter sp. SGAir0037 TaxID=2571030 RepID=UPI0010CCCF28|nr:PD40 domain-containing protein [Pontibacter sp. SGAir0037]QCR24782.1 hypothetical protein C1N53_22115 [Pontibacter sp. SGAir0037]
MINLKHIIVALSLSLSGFSAAAQGETTNWYFGKNAGIAFKPDTAIVQTNGRLITEEGSASISDKDGNLLFYTNGITVWNRNHRVMPNGNGLMGMKSSTQSALILPKPGNDSIYYIFTTDIQAQSNGMRYSIINMKKDGGNGDLVYKNSFMIAPATEKLTAVKHSNNRDWWVIGHRWNSNAYMAYLVSAEGVSVQPVVSNVGTVHGGNNRKAIGYLTPSPDGTRLASALWDDESNFEVLSFNKSTGVISGPILLKGFEEAYGVVFSPDGTKLYGTANGIGGGKAQVIQFDLKAGSAAAISKSAVVVGTSASPRIGAIQLAPDGKIYIARKDSNYLGVISKPNAAGTACTYTDNGFHLAGKKSDMGLPNFPQGITKTKQSGQASK